MPLPTSTHRACAPSATFLPKRPLAHRPRSQRSTCYWIADEKGTTMSDSERAEMFGDLFDGFNPDDYEDEVVERWGETDAYEQSAERTQALTKRTAADQGRDGREHRGVRGAHGRLRSSEPRSPEAMRLAEERSTSRREFYGPFRWPSTPMASIWVNTLAFTPRTSTRLRIRARRLRVRLVRAAEIEGGR